MNKKLSINVILAILAAGVMTFSGVVVETSMSITFPTLISEFNIGISTVQWMTTIYLLVLSSIIPLSKFLKNKFQTRNLFMTANILFILGLLLDIFAPNFWILLAGRFVQGIGTGIALPLMFNIILENVPKERLGFMMGIGSLITASASAVGPTFGGVVLSTLGWRYIFILLIPVLIISLVLGLSTIGKLNTVSEPAERFDITSFILIVLTFTGLILGISNISHNSLISLSVILPVAIGVVSLFFFVTRQNNQASPLLNVKSLTNKSFAKYVFGFFVTQFVTLGLAFIVPNYVQLVNHSNSTVAGLILLPGAVLGAVMSPISGILLDRLGAKKPIVTGVILTIIPLLILSIFAYNLSDMFITILYTIIMLGVGLSYGNIMTQGLSYLPGEMKADGNAILTTVQQFSGAIATVIVSTIIDSTIQASSNSETVATSQGSMYALMFLLVLTLIQVVMIWTTNAKSNA
ncbi:MFS transporter [Holzapfeliella sp. He02]|uniref:MFS transporter n=1 Tax=Holzapfeliella saturejae TaxID=3082953 RepID=A0ABU8SF59_9LACO